MKFLQQRKTIFLDRYDTKAALKFCILKMYPERLPNFTFFPWTFYKCLF